jgi:DNA repair protein RadC
MAKKQAGHTGISGRAHFLHYLAHRKRLRERFRKGGENALHQYELLELLLTYAIPRRDVKPVAKQCLREFHGLAGVMHASEEELRRVTGIGENAALLIRLVKEMCGEYLAERMQKRDLLASPGAVVDFARLKLAGAPHELFMVIFLNVKNEVLDYEVIHEGTVDRAVVYPRRVIEAALARHAAGLILLHNHPSGYPEPSREDEIITIAIADAARTMDIHLLDHIVVGKERYHSLRDRGILDDYGPAHFRK